MARKMSEKLGDFLFGHFSRMSFAVVDDEALIPRCKPARCGYSNVCGG